MTTQIITPETVGHDYQTILPIEEYDESPADPDHRTHIINPPANLHIFRQGMEAQDIVDVARVTGQEVTTLCGYTFIPKRDPEKFDVCEACMRIAGDIMREMGE